MSESFDERRIVVERLVKRYRDAQQPAVDGVSFTVGSGQIYALLGPNGSGKSTTIAMLATLVMPTAGRASVDGHDVVTAPDAVRRRIGVALQDAGVDPAATARELLELHARLLGLGRDERARRADELLAGVGLTDAADRRVRTYSGGMRRRLDLALALVGRPTVVMLDEPTTGLDPSSRELLWARVRTLRDGGTTVLLTTQYLEEADRLADRVGILSHGRLQVEDSPRGLKERYGVATLDDVFFAVTGLERPAREDGEVTTVAA